MVGEMNVEELRETLEIIAENSSSMSLAQIIELAKEPGDDRDESKYVYVHDWRTYVKPSALRKMTLPLAVASLISALRKAGEEEWD
jgi:hypothetical protein